MSDWLTRLLSGEQDGEQEAFRRYAQRLLALARRQLPDRVRRRVDPEDVVQSVYRSFFQRLRDGRFQFEQSCDVWRLLAAMTFHKARSAVRFHQRDRRDVRRDLPLQPGDDSDLTGEGPEPTPSPTDVATLYESLERLLADLPDNYRTIVVGRLEGDSIEQIAQKVARTTRTVLRVLAHVQELGTRQLERSA
jgi:DNA-directed RNA polymerase specialized sigma24 family protein